MTENLEYAEQHLETIRRFGRFPGRNDALGRQSTQEEMNFLKDQKQGPCVSGNDTKIARYEQKSIFKA